MNNNIRMKNKCPVCHRTIEASPQGKSEEVKYLPFCSRRCKLVDLGAWLDGTYKIEADMMSQESDEPSRILQNRNNTQ